MPIDVITLDHQFLGQKNSIASFLMESSDGLILFESGPASTYVNLKSAISNAGYNIQDIRHLFLTHIHLDHAGAAWKFAEKGAMVYVHQLGYKHMNDPSRLMSSAKMIYLDKMDTLWGDMKPIAEDKLLAIDDGRVLEIGGLGIEAIYTPGHAKHHLAWKVEDAIFTGDVAGACINGGPPIPPCPPPDIDIQLWLASLDRLAQYSDARRYFLTHFGEVNDISEHRKKLRRTLTEYADFILPYVQGAISIPEIMPAFVAYAESQLEGYGLKDADIQAYKAANPAEMSVTGLVRYWKKKLAD